ncbi:MAG: hypothetical protein ACFFCX_09865 [Candidatus Sifarchaeia archaeon]
MDEIIIRYWSPHGRQEEKKFHSQEQKIDLTTRAAKKIDLSSLERCNRLVTLNLSNNMLEQLDLCPIKENQTLSEIRLENNHLPLLNLWPLHRCRSLSKLNLTMNRLQSLDITPILTRSQIFLDSSVVLYADYILRFFFTNKELGGRFLLVRADRAPWTAPPVLMWVTYETLSKRMKWSKIRDRILSVLDQVAQNEWYHIQRGLLIGLGMKELAGFDGNPSMLLDTTDDSMDFTDARRAIFNRTVELLDDQISRGGPTLFLDIEGMRETQASKLIAKIVEERKHEIEKTTVPIKGSTSIMNSLWLTHYGYQILEALGVGLQHFGTDIETVKSSFKDLGFSLRTREVESLDKVEISQSVSASISMRKYVYNEIEKAYS